MRMILAMEDAILIVDSQGDRYHARADLTGRAPSCVSTDPRHPARLYCGTFGAGLWRSDDAGDSWEPVAGLSQREVTAVAVSPLEVENGFGVVYAGTEPSAVFRSQDGGSTWQQCPGLARLASASTWSFPPRPDTHHVRWIAPDAVVPGRIFVAIEAGALIHSLDGGASWYDRVPGGPYDTHTLITTAERPDHLFSAAGDGYFESDDGGLSWRQPQAGLQHGYLWSIAIDPRDPGLVIVSAARAARSAHSARVAESCLYCRSNGGAWDVVRDGLPSPRGTTISTVTADPAQPGVFFAANNHGVYRSAGGLVWEKLNIQWPEPFQRQRAQALIVV